MKLTFDWISLINLPGAVIGFFTALIILRVKKGNKTTNAILSMLVLMYSIVIAGFVTWQTKLYYHIPQLTGIFANIYLTLGPLVFLYVKALTTPGFTLKKKYLLHFIPFCLNIAYLMPYYFKSGTEKIAIYENLALHSSISYHVILVLRLVHLSTYLVLTAACLNRHNQKIRESRSNIEKIKLGWLRQLVWAMALFVSAYILFYILSLKNYSTSSPFSMAGKLFGVWQTMIVLFIGYKGLVQPDIFSAADDTQIVQKYKTSTLTREKAGIYREQLLRFMDREKPYLDSELTLKALAIRLSLSYFHLSQIINEDLKQNFYDFVNRYRVEEAKARLKSMQSKENRKITILDVAFDSGFNSKSTFNLVFKKFVHMTPSQFLRQHNRESAIHPPR